MQQIREFHGAELVDSALRFLSIRLRSQPATQALEPPVTAARAVLTKAEDAHRNAIEARVAATAEIEYLDTVLDAAMAALAREVVVLVQNDRNDPRYKKLFAVAPSTAMRALAGEGQELFVRGVITRLKEESDLASLAAHARTLQERLEALRQAVAQRQDLYVPEAQAAADRRIALDSARRVYNGMAPQLMLVLQSERARIDSFFRDLRARRVREEEPVADDVP